MTPALTFVQGDMNEASCMQVESEPELEPESRFVPAAERMVTKKKEQIKKGNTN